MQLNYFFETRAEAWWRQLLSTKKDKQASRNAKFAHIRDHREDNCPRLSRSRQAGVPSTGTELADADKARRIIRPQITRQAPCIVWPFLLLDTPFW